MLRATALVAGLLCSFPAVSQACGSLPPAFWTWSGRVGDQGPIPTDGAILLAGKAWSEYDAPRPAELASTASISVRDANGSLVDGIIEPWYGSSTVTLLWRPRAALAPSSQFHLAASLAEMAARPAQATGEQILALGFTTSEQPAIPLRLTADVRVTLETYDHPVFSSCNDCGECTPNGSIRALRARLTVPPIEGGYAPTGAATWLWVTNDRPHPLPDGPAGFVVNTGGLSPLAASGPTELLLEVPAEDEPHAPCFTLRVFDPAGHFVDPIPTCFPKMLVAATIRDLDAGRGARVQPAGVAGQLGGCAVGAGRPSLPPLLLLLSFCALGGRRRWITRAAR